MLKIFRRVTTYNSNVPGGHKVCKKLRVKVEFSMAEPKVGVKIGNYPGAC